MDIITLKNGLRVANFSSPHGFRFEDGSYLNPVSADDSLNLSMEVKEYVVSSFVVGFSELVNTVRPMFILTDPVKYHLEKWQERWHAKEVDVVIVPRPVIDSFIDTPYIWDEDSPDVWDNLINSPFRTIRLTDRINKICSCNTFCL